MKILVLGVTAAMLVTAVFVAAYGTDRNDDEAAIEKTALDYIEGAFTGDAERMARAIHPELHKVTPYEMPKSGKVALRKSGASQLLEVVRAKMTVLRKDKWNIEVTILDVHDDMASVKVFSSMYYEYLQMAKIDGQWKIINVLWQTNPDAPKG